MYYGDVEILTQSPTKIAKVEISIFALAAGANLGTDELLGLSLSSPSFLPCAGQFSSSSSMTSLDHQGRPMHRTLTSTTGWPLTEKILGMRRYLAHKSAPQVHSPNSADISSPN